MKVDLLGVKIDKRPKREVIRFISHSLASRERLFVVTPYSESIVEAQKDPRYRAVLNSADLALPDGVGVLWAAHFLDFGASAAGSAAGLFFRFVKSLWAIVFRPKDLRNPIPEKISGSEFVWDLARLAEDRGLSVFLLGGFGDTPALAADRLKKKFPKLQIAGTYTGEPAEEGIVERVNRSGADFLFVAFGPKKQEQWIFNNWDKLRVSLAIGLGGTFDYLAGKRLLAPGIFRFSGLEWLWRVLTQPWRFKRVARGVFGLIYYVLRRANQQHKV